MTRILHIIGGLDRGGAESFLMNAWRNIDRKKYQFDIVTFMAPRENNKFVFEDELTAGGAKIYRIKDNRIKAPWKFENDIAKIVKEGNYKIVHSHIDFMSALSLKGAKKGGAEGLISHSHNTYNANLDSPFKKVVSSFLRKRLNSIVKTRLACGENAGKFLYGEGKDFTVIPNGIDLSNFSFSKENRDKLRKEFKLDKDTKAILNVGRLEPVKNQVFLIQAFEEFAQKEKNSALFIIGDGALKNELGKRISDSPVKKRIFLLPSRSDIAHFYSMADIFALPSTFEGIPTVGIEAQASGLKCLFSVFVPEETKVLPNVEFLNIDSTNIWAERIAKSESTNRQKAVTSEKMKKFDIHSSVKKLETVYDSF